MKTTPVTVRCTANRWYKTRTTRKQSALLWMEFSELTGITTLHVNQSGARMDIDIDARNMRVLAELAIHCANKAAR